MVIYRDTDASMRSGFYNTIHHNVKSNEVMYAKLFIFLFTLDVWKR